MAQVKIKITLGRVDPPLAVFHVEHASLDEAKMIAAIKAVLNKRLPNRGMSVTLEE